MIEGQSSHTAAFVAGWRALGQCLPPELRLCEDPLGWRFAPPLIARLRPLIERHPATARRLLLAPPLRRLMIWMQLRTHAIDQVALDFAQVGGEQIVLLGAGFDTRPLRLADELPGVRFFEVDHPATQARKRELLGPARADTCYVPWDFEHDPLGGLADRLSDLGLDRRGPILTIWEGVIPYLTEEAIEETLGAVGDYSGEGSLAVLHYIERRQIQRRTLWHLFAVRAGEPLRFGWAAAELPGWLAGRGFELVSDQSDEQLARKLLPVTWADHFVLGGAGGRIALARPVARAS